MSKVFFNYWKSRTSKNFKFDYDKCAAIYHKCNFSSIVLQATDFLMLQTRLSATVIK